MRFVKKRLLSNYFKSICFNNIILTVIILAIRAIKNLIKKRNLEDKKINLVYF